MSKNIEKENNKNEKKKVSNIDLQDNRIIYLDGEILYIYKKKKPYVTGDGKSKVRELINKKFKQEPVDLSRNLSFDYIPQENEEVTISWKHNLSSGAEPIIVDETDEFLPEIRRVALAAGEAMNIKFASIDVALINNKEILVMEVNGSVCMNKFAEIIPNGYEIAKEIYAKAIDKMFQ